MWRAVEAHARALAVRFPEIEEIRVFGSLVRGTAVPGSDVDLLIVLGASDRPFLDRIPAFLPGAFPCGSVTGAIFLSASKTFGRK